MYTRSSIHTPSDNNIRQKPKHWNHDNPKKENITANASAIAEMKTCLNLRMRHSVFDMGTTSVRCNHQTGPVSTVRSHGGGSGSCTGGGARSGGKLSGSKM